MTVLFVAVSYFNSDSLPGLIDSCKRQTSHAWRLAVVDNSDDADEHSRLRLIASDHEQVQVFRAPANLGYFGGAKWAFERVVESGDAYMCICNVDLVLSDSSFVGKVLDSRCGGDIFAPDIVALPSGRHMNPYMLQRPSTAWVKRRELVFRLTLIGQLYVYLASRRIGQPRPGGTRGSDEQREIYAPQGACIVFEMTALRSFGFPEHPTFLFGEEFTVAEYASLHGLGVIFRPDLRVDHNEHESTGKWRSRAMIRNQGDAARYVSNLIAERSR